MNRLLHRLFAGKKRVSAPDLTSPPVPEAVQKRVQRLEIAFEELEERVVKLTAFHKSLRGRVYGEMTEHPGGKKPASIPYGDKAALRAAVGIRAGQPFHHQE